MNFSNLKLIADENIPYVEEAFGSLGTVKLLPGRSISPAAIKDAQVLLVRSITDVNRELLEQSQVQFVGTATAGLDHIDSEYLRAREIVFASAEGGNANSVAEYVITALLTVARRKGLTLARKSCGIVGVGNIGRLVRAKAEALGMTVVLNDPPLARETGDPIYRSLEEALACDVVTLHVPLTFDGPFKTFHLLNGDTLGQLKPSAIFINTSRGEVVDSRALLDRLQKNILGAAVLDVWESEPDIDWHLFKLASIGTPHIAGYSLDGKAQGTLLLYQALCRHLDLRPTWSPAHSLPPPILPQIAIKATGEPIETRLYNLITHIYNIEADHSRMSALLNIPSQNRALAFDGLRKNYPIRREFYNTRVKLVNGETDWKRKIWGLGFKIV